MVEDRPIMSANIVSRSQFFTFGQNQPTLQRGLSAIAELLVFFFVVLGHFSVIVFIGIIALK